MTGLACAHAIQEQMRDGLQPVPLREPVTRVGLLTGLSSVVCSGSGPGLVAGLLCFFGFLLPAPVVRSVGPFVIIFGGCEGFAA